MNKFLLIPMLIIMLTGCAVAPQPDFDRQAMLENISARVIIPTLEDSVAQSAHLQELAHTFQADPTPQNLSALQDQWVVTAQSWKKAELYELGPIMEARIYNQIDKWPTNVRFIDNLIETEETINQASVEGIGSNSKGLPAIEYLIFDSSLSNDQLLTRFTTDAQAQNRLAYLVALTENLHQKTKTVLTLWQGDGKNYAQTFSKAENTADSISMLSNEMISLLEKLTNTKLNKPLKGSYGTPQPEFSEAYRSETSLELLTSNLIAFQNTFNGADGPGFDDYLDSTGAEYNDQLLSEAINEQIELTLTALQAINQPLHEAVISQPNQVENAHQAMKQLLVLVKVDMANQLGVTVTFNDNDGD